MTAALSTLLEIGEPAILAAVLVFLRVGAVMALLPAFAEQSVPLRIKLALTFAFTAIVAPAVAPFSLPGTDAAFARAAAAEVAVGLALGITLRLAVAVLQMAGTIAANMTSLSQVFGGAGVDPQPAMSLILFLGGLALAAALGLHVKVAIALIGSYDVLPAGTFPLAGDLTRHGIGEIARAFELAFVLAAPFTIAALVYNLALGAINRAMPQLMVAFVGAPAITWGALALLFLAAPTMLAVWSEHFDASLAAPFGGR